MTRSISEASERAFTLLELLAVISISSILLGLASLNYRALENPVENGAEALMGFIKKTRAKALSATLAYTIKPLTPNKIITTYGTTCSSGTQTADPTFTITLPGSDYMTDTNWSVCYGTRGLANASADITVTDGVTSKVVEVVLGGGTRIL